MRKILFILIIFYNTLASAQIQNTWMTGHFLNLLYPKGGIDFSSGSADTFSVFRNLGFYAINTMINDSSGNLLFYTNGIYIANANHDTLLNSKNYNPGDATTMSNTDGLNISQSVIILPISDSVTNYRVFHCSSDLFSISGIVHAQTLSLSYSMIDMTLDQGLGGIIANQKNVTIINDTLINGHMDAARHANGRDWWVLFHRYNSDKFYKILVTPDTIEVFDQDIGSVIINNVAGQAAFSPDGSKYVLFTENSLDLYDFDRCSGDLSNYHSLNLPDSIWRTGAAFSPNSRFLYTNTYLNIFQYDLQSSNIDSSIQLVAQWDTAFMPFATIFWNSQLAPDGKIYIGTWNGDEILHYIDHPDSLGINCNVVQNSFYLASRNLTVPTYPNYQLGRLIGSPCDTLTSIAPLSELEQTIRVFPNPASQFFNVVYEFDVNTNAEFILSDATGKEVLRKKLYGTFTSLLVQTGKLDDGIYFYEVRFPDRKSANGKIVIMK